MFKRRGGWVPYAGKRSQIRAYPLGRGFVWFVAALFGACLAVLVFVAVVT